MRHFAIGLVVGLLTIPVGVVIAARMGALPTKAEATAPGWETAFARMALHSAAAHNAPHRTNPIAPTDSNLRAGLKLYRSDCTGCHGSPTSLLDTTQSLYPEAPQFAKHAPRSPDWQLFWIVKYGVRYSGMFAWDGQFGKDSTGRDISDEKIWSAVTFLSHLESLPPAVDSEWHRKPSREPSS